MSDGPVDLSKLREQRGNGQPAPGERTPMKVSILGTPGGPWALIDDGGNTIAMGMGDASKGAILGMVSLAALAVRVATPEAVQEAVGNAQATIAAQAQAAAAQHPSAPADGPTGRTTE